jgi:hypothetical protein
MFRSVEQMGQTDVVEEEAFERGRGVVRVTCGCSQSAEACRESDAGKGSCHRDGRERISWRV